MPKLLKKYIDMQSTLCPVCKEREIITVCNREHLEKVHRIDIATVVELAENLNEVIERK